MSATTRKTVTFPSGQLAEAVARQIRHRSLGDELRRHQEENGAFTDRELADARAKILGETALGRPRDAA